MFLDAFKICSLAVFQIFLLGLIGYVLVKKEFLGHDGLETLSRLVIEVTLPILIFCQLVKDFNFSLYPNWWIFPLISVIITALGLLIGILFVNFIHGLQHKMQFLSLVTFQNSGYLPLVLVAALLPPEKLGVMFIYLFFFLAGFNLLIFSVGEHMLSLHVDRRFEFINLFNPPVIATVFSLIFIFLGLHKFVPDAFIKPMRMIGDCTLPLAMFVVGGNLAQIKLSHIDSKAMFLMTLAKMLIMPALGLWLVIKFNLPELLGLLILIQLAMPPATLLSIIIKHYKREDLFISQGIFLGHLISIITIPVFLSLYFTLSVIR
jgi:predicted permease